VRSTTTNTNTNTNNLQQPYYSLNRYMLEVRSLRVYFSTISSDSFYSFVFVAAGGGEGHVHNYNFHNYNFYYSTIPLPSTC